MRTILPIAAAIALALLAARNYASTATRIHLWVDGEQTSVATHGKTVAALLEQEGLHLTASDVVWPSPETALAEDMTVQVARARSVVIRADGRSLTIQTQARTPEEMLQEAGVPLGPKDIVLLDQQSAAPQFPSIVSEQRVLSSRGDARIDIDGTAAGPHVLDVYRAVEVIINDGGVQSVLYSTAPTVGEALWEAGLQVYLGDSVVPDLGAPLTPGMAIFIDRAVPIDIQVDGQTRSTRTQATTVGEALALEGVALLGMDFAEPGLTTPVSQGLSIRVVRQRQQFLVEQQPVSYSVVWRPDPLLEIDQRRVQIPGEEGLTKRRIRLVLRDGVEVERQVMDDWLARPPQDQVIAYGTKIITRQLDTPYGPIEYWRKIRVLATSYTAATSGKTRDHPTYGITRVGWTARTGIIAVDPTVINLLTKAYVPGYGIADVGDTGGGIKGRRIDLCYDEDELVLWYKWVDIYLLAPAPPADSIRYVLPDWPLERR